MDSSKVYKFLSECDSEIIRFIELQLQFATDIRTYQSKYVVTNEELAVEMRCDVARVEDLQRGSCEVSLSDMAILRTLYAKRIAEENANLKLAK